MDRDSVVALLGPLSDTVATLDLTDPEGAVAALTAAHPPSTLGALHEGLRSARDAGWLTPRRATPSLTFGRVVKPALHPHGYAIDVVDMEGVGAAHTHPAGEVNLCFVESGDPRFDGAPAGWVVNAPGSHHAPTVTGGRMLILYWLPEGSIAFD